MHKAEGGVCISKSGEKLDREQWRFVISTALSYNVGLTGCWLLAANTGLMVQPKLKASLQPVSVDAVTQD